MQSKDELLKLLRKSGNEHLLAFWDGLRAEEQRQLSENVSSIDFAALQRFVSGADGSPDWQSLAQRAQPPRAIRLTGRNEFSREAASARGEEALRRGTVGMILVAGGQGTRLGFPHPKGMLPLGPVSKRTLFQILIDRLRSVAAHYGVTIPLYVMTSPATHDETVQYFRENNYLGLAENDLRFFCQGMLPAVDRSTGKVLLETRNSVALSPDGHGGMLAAFDRSGCLADVRKRGVELLFYGQVDNPLLQICDPALLGYHLLSGSEMTTQVVEKRHALERVGNVVEIDGRTQIIEYSDLPEEAARREASNGTLDLWAGNLAVHVFNTQFLVRQAGDADALPIHRAVKKVSFVDERGQTVEPSAPNAIKFERFIFDLLPRAKNALVVEVAPADAFAPVKNAPGEASDTPETARDAMIQRDRTLLEGAGAKCDPLVEVEVNPLWAYDSGEAAAKLPAGCRISKPTYFA